MLRLKEKEWIQKCFILPTKILIFKVKPKGVAALIFEVYQSVTLEAIASCHSLFATMTKIMCKIGKAIKSLSHVAPTCLPLVSHFQVCPKELETNTNLPMTLTPTCLLPRPPRQSTPLC